MGLSSRFALHARPRNGPRGIDDRGAAAAIRATLRGRLTACLLAASAATPAAAELRLAYYHTELSRDGPGLLLRDIRSGDSQVTAVAKVVAAAHPDILVLGGIDWDLAGAALAALAERIAAAGHPLPHRFAARPNTGLPTGLDLDGDGRRGTARDAQGYGRFAGQGGLAVLSRLPILKSDLVSFTDLLWHDLPGADPPSMSPEIAAVQHLSSTAHLSLPIALPGGGTLKLLVWHATAPVFDGPEDRNGRRNHDEAALWINLLEGKLAVEPPTNRFAVIGTANIDPTDGEGRRGALRALLGDLRLQDPRPASAGGRAAAEAQGGANAAQQGNPALDTADWRDADGPGNLRVDYVLPSRDLAVTGAGVVWPLPGSPLADTAERASRHRLVWVDLAP